MFLPFPYLQAALGLDRVQSQCLALALLPELEEGFADAYAALEPVGEGFLTAGLALCLLEGTGRGELRSALAPSGALMGCALEPAEGPTRLTTPLRPERRVVDFALWDAWEEPETPGLTLVPAGNGAPFPPELWDLAGRMAEYLRRAEGEGRLIPIGDELPKSVVLCAAPYGDVLYLSPLSSATLARRFALHRPDGKFIHRHNKE